MIVLIMAVTTRPARAHVGYFTVFIVRNVSCLCSVPVHLDDVFFVFFFLFFCSRWTNSKRDRLPFVSDRAFYFYKRTADGFRRISVTSTTNRTRSFIYIYTYIVGPRPRAYHPVVTRKHFIVENFILRFVLNIYYVRSRYRNERRKNETSA